MCSRDACLVDELTNDYESWNAALPQTQDQHPTEAVTTAESREPVVLISAAWNYFLLFVRRTDD